MQKCSWNRRLSCSWLNQKTCPFKMAAFIVAVEKWGLCRRSLHSINPGVILAGRDNQASERKAVELANINQLFRDPEAVLAWVEAGAIGRAPIPKAVCDDLKQAGRRWRLGREWEKSTRESVQNGLNGTRGNTATQHLGGGREA